MTAIFMDGFDHYGIGTNSKINMLAGTYASGGSCDCNVPTWGPARTGAACLRLSGNEQAPQRKVLPTPGTHFFVSFGFAVDQLWTSGPGQNFDQYSIIAFQDGSANTIVKLSWTPTGALQLVSVNPGTGVGTLLGITSGPVIVAENWHFMEMEINTTGGVNTFTLRVDDAQATNAPVLSITNAAITGTIANIALHPTFTGSGLQIPQYMDDLFIRDPNGTQNNSWLGDRRIATLFANADTTTSGWTPSYYHEFGAGILQLSSISTGSSTNPQNSNANVQTPPASALDIGNGDFTLETFVRFDQLPSGTNYSSIFSRWDTGTVPNSKRAYRLILGSPSFNGGCLQFDTTTDGTASTLVTKIQYPWTPLLNTWHHVALVRASGELLLFIDGQQMGIPVTDTQTYFSGGIEAFLIGGEGVGGSNPAPVSGTNLIGRLDETRFTNGFARYTAPFAVPTVAFPRGSVADPQWAQVVLLAGWDSGIIDESGFGRPLNANGGAVSFQPNDGPAIGVYSTINKPTPDDNTFISANLLNATNVLTMITQPTAGNTVTVGTKDGTTPAVYTWRTAVSAAFDVLIDTTPQNSLINLLNAINAGAGSGTKYGTGTTSNFDVTAIQLPVGQIEVMANQAGTGGNSIPSTSTGTAAVWASATLLGGASIPGPSDFKLQRPPNNTTLISAMQMNMRALKTDAGTANIQQGFIGALGGINLGSVRPLTVAANYYTDIFETDPDTHGAITPTTIVNGKFQINRTS